MFGKKLKNNKKTEERLGKIFMLAHDTGYKNAQVGLTIKESKQELEHTMREIAKKGEMK